MPPDSTNVLPRSSGVQLHATSLPDGHLGAQAYRFVDWLAEAGQTWWQVLPLGPPDRHRSPYKARSAFASWRGLLADPRAPVTHSEELEFRDRERYWIFDWEKLAGRGAVADQVRFSREWGSLRSYARERGIRVFGDMPIYVAEGSADHRAHPELFQDGLLAGAPPDAYTDRGQLWGNPLYDWPALQRRGYRWWVERLRRAFSLFDLVRIDHFRGFVAYWAVPERDRDARGGTWRRGPGRAPFDAAGRSLGSLPLVAEDLGVITPAVERLRDSLGLPGMVVIQFGFDPKEPDSPHRFENHVENRLAYTGTHDHDTARGWLDSLGGERRALLDAELERHGIALDRRRPWWSVIRLAFASPARVAMVQAQDVLGLGSEARMNSPARASGNWRWRLERGALTKPLARRLREVTDEAGRISR
ncbi:MAG TPA: 4-alpha-glucanotransferase [Thermoleophilaceae bacterium]|nr:4-alpha-glucanotransferase [Thermoleophilaceae bacterium]